MSRGAEPSGEAKGAAYLRACDRLLWRLDRARWELRDILSRTEAWLIQVPRRDVEHLLSWFEAVEDEDGNEAAIRTAIEDRIETLIACLDAFDTDSDLEEDQLDNDELREPDELVA